MPSDSAVDVLIIGAGPAGLMCGFALSQAGLNVRIVDRKSTRLLKGQADAIHPRGTEILDSIGLGSKVLADASRVYMYTTYKDGPDGKVIRVAQRNAQLGVESPFKYLLINAQSTVEGILRDAMGNGDRIIRGFTNTSEAELPAPKKLIVEHNIHPTQMSLSDNPTELADPKANAVTVTLGNGNGDSETVKAKYVLGCDGAHSWTRAQLGIDMVGDNSDDVWGLIDGYVDSDFPDLRTLAVLENNGTRCAIIPREHTIIKKVFAQYRVDFIGDPDWWGVYVVGQRLASAYSDSARRVFIVGDACHTHSPHAGQGMNAAMTDGHNLFWKLIHVLKGWAHKDILDTYEPERRGFAKELMHLHEKLAEVTSGKVQGASTADVHAKASAFVAGTGVRYGESQIVNPLHQELAPGIPVGGRFPHQIILRTADCWPCSTHNLLKSDPKYKLLIFTGDATAAGKSELLEKLSEGYSNWSNQSSARRAMIQVYTILRSKKDSCSYTTVPVGLRSSWDTVFMDDIALTETDGGGAAYETFGIGDGGCMVLVRPDGYVAGIVPLDGVKELDGLFERMVKGV